MVNIFTLNYANDWIIEEEHDMIKIKPKDFNPIKADFIISKEYKLIPIHMREIVEILYNFCNIQRLNKMMTKDYLKNIKLVSDTLIFSSENIIFTIINKEKGVEILVLDKDENLILNILCHESYITEEDYDVIYETCKEILKKLL